MPNITHLAFYLALVLILSLPTTQTNTKTPQAFLSAQIITHQTSNIDVVGDLNIQAGNINIQGSKGTQMQSKSSGGLFGGSSKYSSNSQTITNQGSELDISKQLNIQNQQTQIIASKVQTNAIRKTLC